MTEKDVAIALIFVGVVCLMMAISICLCKFAKKVDNKYQIPDYEEGEYYDKH